MSREQILSMLRRQAAYDTHGSALVGGVLVGGRRKKSVKKRSAKKVSFKKSSMRKTKSGAVKRSVKRTYFYPIRGSGCGMCGACGGVLEELPDKLIEGKEEKKYRSAKRIVEANLCGSTDFLFHGPRKLEEPEQKKYRDYVIALATELQGEKNPLVKWRQDRRNLDTKDQVLKGFAKLLADEGKQ